MRYAHILTRLVALAGLALASAVSIAATVPSTGLTGALQWRNVGPYVGGRSIAVAGIASEPSHFYMGTTDGGVWETLDYGQSWKNISDGHFTNNVIGAIAVAPSNPKVIYVGTGESDIRNTFLTGEGMYKSVDGGKSWQHVGLDATHIISWILVDPKDPDVVYAASLGHVWGPNPERGVFKSTDGGKTWNKVLYINDHTGVVTMAMDPSDPDTLYATAWEASRRAWTFSSGGPGSGIYKSTDGGAHWSNITHNPGLPDGIIGKAGIAVAPSDPNVVYALIQANYQGHSGGLFKSNDAGRTWAFVNGDDELTQRAFYYMRVYVDPKDADTIYMPNVNVYVSHDSGKTLDKLKPPHGDNHAFWINPNDTKLFIESNDGGATVSRDGGSTWSAQDNQPTAQLYHVNVDDQFPFNIYVAQQDNRAWVGPSAVRHGKIPPVWDAAAGGESSWVTPQPDKHWITYGNGYFSLMDSLDHRTGVNRSIDPSPFYYNGAPASEMEYRAGWIRHPNAFLPHAPNVLLTGTQYLLKSTDFGHTWARISPDLTRNDKSKQELPGGPISHDISGAELFDTLSALSVSPRSDDVIWAGSDDGLVHVTRDGGAHWDDVTPKGLPTWITITDLEASHVDAGTAYMTASRYMWDDFKPYAYKTSDYGKHWQPIVQGVPGDQYLETIREDPDHPGLLFLGSSKTVYLSLDDAVHWQSFALNLPSVVVRSIAIQAPQDSVVIATHGRGVWILDNLGFVEQLASAQVASDQPYLFAPQPAWLVKRSAGFGGGSVGGENRPAVADVFYYLPPSYQPGTPAKLTFSTADGQVVRSYDLPYQEILPRGLDNGKAKKPKALHAGMNHFAWDFRYAPARYVDGFYVTEGGVDKIVGPTIAPGTYEVTLSYDNTAVSKQPFEVKLDPRLATTPAQMQARVGLATQINQAIDSLNSQLNEALAARTRLQQAVAGGQVVAGRAKAVSSDLDRDIGAMVNLDIQSSEGDLVVETRVTERLAMLGLEIDGSFTPLRPVNQQGYATLSAMAETGKAALQKDVAAVKGLLGAPSK
ncbi:MAG TPA: hypothetical protein VN614_05215 [Rhodanobacter sp.]|nr:hypothetical protein [Rhodanobacter sp.]